VRPIDEAGDPRLRFFGAAAKPFRNSDFHEHFLVVWGDVFYVCSDDPETFDARRR